MSDCLFFLHFSLHSEGASSFRISDRSLNQITDALCRRFDSLTCVAWTADVGVKEAECLQRHGYSIMDGPDPVAWLKQRLTHVQPGAALVIAASPEVGRELHEKLEYGRAEVWTTESEPDHSSFRNLQAMIGDTGPECSVFIDWTYLQQLGAGPLDGAEGKAVAEHLLSLASIAGRVVDARAYRVAGESTVVDFSDDSQLRSSPGNLREELAQAIEQRSSAHTWVVMAPGRSLPPLSRSALDRGDRIVLWAEGEAIPDVDTSIDARHFLHGFRLPAPGELQPVSEPEAVLDASAGHWVRLAYYVECAQRQSASGKLDYARLVAALSQQEEFGLNADAAEAALRRGLDFGLIQQHEDRNCRLNANHAAARFAVEVPERVLRLLNQMLQRMPWVSFKLLRSVLAREQWLGGAAYGLDEAQIDDWINFLIRDGALTMSKEPNLVAPEFPVTALRVSPTHPLTGAAPPTESGACGLSRERAILAVDHFLVRHHKPWMSMGALRRALECLGRDELQEVLRSLQNGGALVTERYPNPQRDQPTTGCRLRYDNPFVAETLATRNTLLRAAAEGEGPDGWTPLSRLELVFEKTGALSGARQNAWLRLLLDESILELSGDPDDLVRGGAHVLCRANRLDPVVRSVIGVGFEPLAGLPAAASAVPPSFRSLTRRPVEPQEPVIAN